MTGIAIKVSSETKKQLDEMKEHYRETYEDVIQKMMWETKKQSKSIVSTTPIKKDELIKRNMLSIGENSKGLSPRFIPKLVGKRTLYDIKKGEPITFGLVEL